MLLACLLAQAGNGDAGSATQVRTLVDVRGTVFALAQDGHRVAWLRGPDWRPRVEILDLGTGQRRQLPAFAMGANASTGWTMPSLALAGDRAVYVLGEAWGNTGLAYSIVTAAPGDRRARLLYYDDSMSRPALRERFPWPLASDRDRVVFAGGERLRRLAGLRTRPVSGRFSSLLSVGGDRYASAWLRSHGGCVCNVSPSWSPDGTRLVYGSGERLGQANAPWQAPHHIHVVQANGSGNRVIARGRNPDWSPDGALIAFERQQKTAISVSVIRPDGTSLRRLTIGRDPDWSPDGRQIAFVRARAIFVADSDGTDARRLAPGYTPTWSPEGRRIAFTGPGGGIYVMNRDGTRRFRLKGAEDYAGSPSWQPDGRRVAFTVIDADDFTETVHRARIGLANADGSFGTRWLELPRSAVTAAWSDGGRVAFAGFLPRRHPSRGIPSTEIFIAEGGTETRVTRTRPPEPTSIGIVRRLQTGKTVTQLAIRGSVLDIALARTYLAALVEGFSGKRIEVFDARTGRRLRRVQVPTGTAPSIAVGDTRVVITVGRQILSAGTRNGELSTLVRAAVVPRSLSVEGRRLVWLESAARRTRVRSLTLPN